VACPLSAGERRKERKRKEKKNPGPEQTAGQGVISSTPHLSFLS
jgi:hypothetical protein